jgi:hypothetical protein
MTYKDQSDELWHTGKHEIDAETEEEAEKMSTIIDTDDGPCSSCCHAEIKCQKDYTDTHVYVVFEAGTDDNGKVVSASYAFEKTYDGISGDNWSVTCSQCGQEIETADIEFEES